MRKVDTIVRNGQVFDAEAAVFERRDVGIYQGRFVAVDRETEAASEINAENRYVVPGLC